MPTKKVVESVPRRLTTLLKSIRKEIFGLDIQTMSDKLEASKRVQDKAFTIDRNAVSDIENRRKILRYEHLETYALALGLPTGILLLFSRYQYDSISEAEDVLDAFAQVINNARVQGRTLLSIEDLKDMSNRLKLTPNDIAPRLEARSQVDFLASIKTRLGDDTDKLSSDLPLWENRKE